MAIAMGKHMKRGRSDSLEKDMCAKAMWASVENAQRFLQDAKTLYAQGRYQSAALLGIFAFDEVGKAGLLKWAQTLSLESEKEWTEFWRAFYLHEPKLWFANFNAGVSLIARASGVKKEDLLKYLDRTTKKIHSLREKVAYVDICNGDVERPKMAT
ncbi:MAG: AbiV family abortive infection protein, partial [Nitrospirota bacterium]|nr:AbiV family abortive infection protein [Nitrospirota bacterium]